MKFKTLVILLFVFSVCFFSFAKARSFVCTIVFPIDLYCLSGENSDKGKVLNRIALSEGNKECLGEAKQAYKINLELSTVVDWIYYFKISPSWFLRKLIIGNKIRFSQQNILK